MYMPVVFQMEEKWEIAGTGQAIVPKRKDFLHHSLDFYIQVPDELDVWFNYMDIILEF